MPDSKRLLPYGFLSNDRKSLVKDAYFYRRCFYHFHVAIGNNPFVFDCIANLPNKESQLTCGCAII
jgi:hypothetical protein